MFPIYNKIIKLIYIISLLFSPQLFADDIGCGSTDWVYNFVKSVLFQSDGYSHKSFDAAHTRIVVMTLRDILLPTEANHFLLGESQICKIKERQYIIAKYVADRPDGEWNFEFWFDDSGRVEKLISKVSNSHYVMQFKYANNHLEIHSLWLTQQGLELRHAFHITKKSDGVEIMLENVNGVRPLLEFTIDGKLTKTYGNDVNCNNCNGLPDATAPYLLKIPRRPYNIRPESIDMRNAIHWWEESSPGRPFTCGKPSGNRSQGNSRQAALSWDSDVARDDGTPIDIGRISPNNGMPVILEKKRIESGCHGNYASNLRFLLKQVN